ncbi:hypothetical protein [Streptomyces sp. 8P21H-1]|uniref:hypothetical protein n=1 Tax=Streptomyces sp. 8P21H-1 TaxID=2737048 RepID=UPI0015712B83|nr:hypothetical protein [Streptomyces sp. 8P21H-1]NSL43838.1 hypothetical protein [Streptomyces sp. 8P21H-1]
MDFIPYPGSSRPEIPDPAPAAGRAEGIRARDAILAEGRIRREAHCATAETELRIAISELASNLAGRALEEHTPPPSGERARE